MNRRLVPCNPILVPASGWEVHEKEGGGGENVLTRASCRRGWVALSRPV